MTGRDQSPAPIPTLALPTPAAPPTLTVAVSQFATAPALAQNRDGIVGVIAAARRQGARLVVFPEGALAAPAATPRTEIDAAVREIRAAAAAHGIAVVLGLLQRRSDDEPLHNQALVIDADGRVILQYDKLWGDDRFCALPPAFTVDGVRCGLTICADRWLGPLPDLPAMAGAQILIECSNNLAEEWKPDLGWHWYVPRAIRNQAFVLLANTPRDDPGRVTFGDGPGHGHSVIIGPDGDLVAAAGEEPGRLLVATLPLARATLGEARRRLTHPILGRLWQAGLDLCAGRTPDATEQTPPTPPATMQAATPTGAITIAVAQLACARDVAENVARMARMIEEAAAAGADVVAFPELALTGAIDEDIRRCSLATLDAALARLGEAARTHRLVVAFGGPAFDSAGRRSNAAYVLDASGRLATRYDQMNVDRPDLFASGASTRAMWYTVRGVPAVVTLGSDAHWTELAEIAATGGAQVHLHLAYDRFTNADAALVRRQWWVNLASYYTVTATVNAASPVRSAAITRPSAPASGGSTIWTDARQSTLHGRVHDGERRWCAAPVAEAAEGECLLLATLPLAGENWHTRAMHENAGLPLRGWWDVAAHLAAVE